MQRMRFFLVFSWRHWSYVFSIFQITEALGGKWGDIESEDGVGSVTDKGSTVHECNALVVHKEIGINSMSK